MRASHRLESAWQKIKTTVNRFIELDKTVASVMFWKGIAQRDWHLKLNEPNQRNTDALDYELIKLDALVGGYAWKLVQDQYAWAMKDSTMYQRFAMSNRLVFVTYVPPAGDQLLDDMRMSTRSIRNSVSECACL